MTGVGRAKTRYRGVAAALDKKKPRRFPREE
jgi:hypothetical protein